MVSQRRGGTRRRTTVHEGSGKDDDDSMDRAGGKAAESFVTSWWLWCGIFVGLSLIGILGVIVSAAASPKSSMRPMPNVRGGTSAQPKQCSIYTAPTSLIGVPSMGIFTTRDIRTRQSILAAAEGPTVTLTASSKKSKLFPKHSWFTVWGNYAWGRGRGLPEHVSYESKTLMDFQIGTGALPNHHCLLESIYFRFPDPAYDDSMTEHRQSPGTGAYSYNMGRDFYVDRDVEAGEELFLNYGHCHRDGNNPEWAKNFPMTEDYEEAAAFIMKKIKKNIDENEKLMPPTLMKKNALSLVPETLSELKLRKSSTELDDQDVMMALARRSTIQKRTPEWIREHGKCLEHIVPRKSQIPHAGHGGFALHYISKGDVVVPAPMMHIMDKEVLATYDTMGHSVGQQLILNYCLSHPESSLLLCPNTNAVLINHCSTRMKQEGCSAPNAEYRWNLGWDATSDEWRGMSLDEIAKQPYRGLHMDVVALRDIVPGEEVFVDYGVDWEEAWKTHVATWHPPEPISISAREANDRKEPPAFLLTGDMRAKVRHDHIFAGCQYWTSKEDKNDVWDTPDPNWTDRTDEDLLQTYADDGSRFVGKYRFHPDLSYWPCVIIRPEDDDSIHSSPENYLVRILQHPYHDAQPWAENQLPRFLTQYPASSIHYFVKQGDGDNFLPNVFRHPIAMPDDMFPEQWKNLKR